MKYQPDNVILIVVSIKLYNNQIFKILFQYERYKRELVGLKQVEKDNNLTQIQIGRLSFLEESFGFIKPFYGKEIENSVRLEEIFRAFEF